MENYYAHGVCIERLSVAQEPKLGRGRTTVDMPFNTSVIVIGVVGYKTTKYFVVWRTIMLISPETSMKDTLTVTSNSDNKNAVGEDHSYDLLSYILRCTPCKYLLLNYNTSTEQCCCLLCPFCSEKLVKVRSHF